MNKGKNEIKTFQSKLLGANLYLVHNSKIGIVIDPCVSVDIVSEYCNQHNIKPVLIILTHAHIDHMLYLEEFKNEFNIKDAVHTCDRSVMGDSHLNGATLFGMKKAFKQSDIVLNDGDIINEDGIELKVIHTPGHTEGGICLYGDGFLFTGDTLFHLSIGRSDLGRGDANQLLESIKNKLFVLPEDTIVYPGHGASSTIGFEKENNPFIY